MGITVDVRSFDATDFDQHPVFFDEIKQDVDVAILAFGSYPDQQDAFVDFNIARAILEVNFLGAVSICNLIAREFQQRKAGIIIGISSVAGDRGRAKNFIYGSSKAGFTAYLSGLRNALFPSGVHVCSVIPGFVDTKMTKDLDLKPALTASPEEVAHAIYTYAFKKKRNVVYVKPIWRWIMLVIQWMPEFIFKRLKIG